MIQSIWLNFPVKDLTETKDFFSKIGFSLNEQQTNDGIICFEVGAQKTAVLFFPEEILKGFMKNEISDTRKGSEIMISFDAESRDEVDETARKVFDAGGTIIAEPAEMHGSMYGFAFADLDGHRRNQIYMDFSKMPPE